MGSFSHKFVYNQTGLVLKPVKECRFKALRHLHFYIYIYTFQTYNLCQHFVHSVDLPMGSMMKPKPVPFIKEDVVGCGQKLRHSWELDFSGEDLFL